MKMKQLQQLFKTSILVMSIAASVSVFAQSKDEIVAIVDNNVILRSDLSQSLAELQQQYQQQNSPTPPVEILEQQALEQLILREAQLEQVKKFNIRPDEKSLNEAMTTIAKQAGVSSLEAFQQKLDTQQPGMYENLRARVAEDLAINRLRQQAVMSRIKISDQDVNNFLNTPQGQAALGTQVHVLHLKISGANAKQLAEQARKELSNNNNIDAISRQLSNHESKVEAADMGFRSLSDIPSELAARVSVLNPGQTTEIIPVNNDFHILKLVERKDADQKALIPQYKVRHILIQPSQVVSEENAQQQIESIYNRLQAGEDFATLAATFSNDPGSARDGGNLGWVNPGVMVPVFEETMKNTPVGQISKPFKSQFGWHILQVTDTRQQDMTKEYHSQVARQILGERQFDSELDSWLRELRNNAYVDIKDPNLAPQN
ncbi:MULTISPECIES: peptidylprolyl isomerase [unclassified Acinetobacter]|uniref:peptidylprolyl isomerase n=1 Tax=unclassified Acinetobacter TaxID=196816 RepID=UPI002934A902|nr:MULTISPECIES: peptidylprolyl isomerase [unclassified Acinetobacter]WOE32048.1 peptidylprolyl isomerase [Acinetobacter sp. SAAs470]WOE37517.1 peptidylprolyl isomerase [Acinetobacter sp. SAAs474]